MANTQVDEAYDRLESLAKSLVSLINDSRRELLEALEGPATIGDDPRSRASMALMVFQQVRTRFGEVAAAMSDVEIAIESSSR